jgi:hypothetical protein
VQELATASPQSTDRRLVTLLAQSLPAGYYSAMKPLALVTASIAGLAPAIGCADSPTEPPALSQTLETVQAALDLVTSRPWPIEGSCSGTVINCPGGTLATPVIVTLTRTAVEAALVPGSERYDFSVTLSAVSATGIPVTVPAVGACILHFDTAPGTSPTVTVSGSARFESQTPGGPIDRLAFFNLAVSGVENADMSLTGSFACTLADAYISFFSGIVVDELADFLARYATVCAAPGPALFRPCPAPAARVTSRE